VVGRSRVAALVSADLGLPNVGLAQGFSLVLWTPDDFDQFGESDREAEPAGFLYSHSRLLEVLARRSGVDGLAYVEAEFFGGSGDQGAVLFRRGEVEWLSEFGPIGRVMPLTPISEALQRLGVERGKFADEFDALQLGRHRNMEDWFEDVGRSDRDKPWTAPAKELVLYRDGDGWRFAVANESGIMDGRLSVNHTAEVDAQADLLARVEESTGLRYSAKWRLDKPGWWSAALRKR